MGQPGDSGKEYEPDWRWGDITYTDSWSFDWNNSVIFHTGEDNEKTSMVSLYSFIADIFEDWANIYEPMPMIAVTPSHVKMDNGWSIAEESIKFLKSGSIEQNGEIYAEFHALGGVPYGVISKLHINSETSTYDIMEGEEYKEMLKMDLNRDMHVRDKGNLVEYHFSIRNFYNGALVVPNPLCQLSGLPKSMLKHHYDTELLGLPG